MFFFVLNFWFWYFDGLFIYIFLVFQWFYHGFNRLFGAKKNKVMSYILRSLEGHFSRIFNRVSWVLPLGFVHFWQLFWVFQWLHGFFDSFLLEMSGDFWKNPLP